MTTDAPAPFVELHAVFEADHPQDAEAEREYENAREAQYERTHGSLDGYRPRRRFPCPGAIREVDRNKTHRTLACDVCGWETTVRVQTRPSGVAASSEEQW